MFKAAHVWLGLPILAHALLIKHPQVVGVLWLQVAPHEVEDLLQCFLEPLLASDFDMTFEMLLSLLTELGEDIKSDVVPEHLLHDELVLPSEADVNAAGRLPGAHVCQGLDLRLGSGLQRPQ